MHSITRAARGMLLAGVAVVALATLAQRASLAQHAQPHTRSGINTAARRTQCSTPPSPKSTNNATQLQRAWFYPLPGNQISCLQPPDRRQRHVHRRPQEGHGGSRCGDRQRTVDVHASGHRAGSGLLGEQGHADRPLIVTATTASASSTPGPASRSRPSGTTDSWTCGSEPAANGGPNNTRDGSRKSLHRRIECRRRLWIPARRHSRIRRDQRQPCVDVSHDPAARRIEFERSPERLEVAGWREHLGRHHSRREEWLGLLAVGIADARPVRRAGRATTCSATAFWRSTLARDNGYGTFRSSTVICGTTT